MHRSGTTWLGAVLDNVPALFSMHEPFNVDHGLRNVPRWYLDHRDCEDRQFFWKSIDETLGGIAKYRRKFELNRPISSMLRGNGSERDYRVIS